jgi:uncharacterized protein YbjT (DUF2867 family)
VAIARERGHHVVSISRPEGVDLVNGRGLAQALKDTEAVIDVSGIQTTSTKKAVDFFTNATQNLLAAGQQAGVRHHLALSIVGIDGATSGLYAGKLVQEDEVKHGGIPWTLLRSTQFHEFVPMAIRLASVGPLVFVPTMVMQPVAAREVAAALVDAAEAGPQGRLRDLGGPRTEQLKDLVAAYLHKTGQKKRIVPLHLPGNTGKAMRRGRLIPAAGSAVGRQTFLEWLEAGADVPGDGA